MATITEIKRQHPLVIVELGQEILGINAQEIADFFLQDEVAACTHIVVLMNNVEQISSAGLRALVQLKKDALYRDGDVRFVNPSERVNKVLEVAAMSNIFHIFKTQEEAVTSFNTQ